MSTQPNQPTDPRQARYNQLRATTAQTLGNDWYSLALVALTVAFAITLILVAVGVIK